MRSRPQGWILIVGCFAVAGCATVGEDHASLTQLRTKAEQGDASAQFQLGQIYDRGVEVKKNETEAASWYRKAAEQGYAAAQNNLGSLCQFGEGVPRSDAEAVKWYQKAVNQGYAEAYANLGFMYNRGLSVSKDPTNAVTLYRTAADKGSLVGMLNLGVCYWQGNGIAQDLVQAYMWIDLARAYSSTSSDDARVHKTARAAWYVLEREMKPGQVSAAEKLEREWDTAHGSGGTDYVEGIRAEDAHDLNRARQHYYNAYTDVQKRNFGPAAQARPLYEWSRVTGHLGNYDEAEQGFTKTLGLIEQAHGDAYKLLPPTLCELARLLHDTDQHAKAVPIYERAVVELDKVNMLKVDPLGFAAFLDEYSESLRQAGFALRADEIAARSASIKEQNKGGSAKFVRKRY